MENFRNTNIYKKLIWIYFTKFKPNNGPHSDRGKQKHIIRTAATNNIRVFVETGTYIGETVRSVQPYFKQIFSIELNKKLFIFNKKRFANNKNVKIIYGDSARQLEKIIPKIGEKTLYWLDAHFSGGITSKTKEETPIVTELKTIVRYWIIGSAVMIDDARLFNGQGGYPHIKLIKDIVSPLKCKVFVKNDIIYIK